MDAAYMLRIPNKVGPASGNAHDRFSFLTSYCCIHDVQFVDYIDVTKQVDLFYHVEFEGRDCVLVQAFVMSLDNSS